jgi:hypothetical protein
MVAIFLTNNLLIHEPMLCKGIILLGHISLITQMSQKKNRLLARHAITIQGFTAKD